jgi:hypothetical protein
MNLRAPLLVFADHRIFRSNFRRLTSLHGTTSQLHYKGNWCDNAVLQSLAGECDLHRPVSNTTLHSRQYDNAAPCQKCLFHGQKKHSNRRYHILRQLAFG